MKDALIGTITGVAAVTVLAFLTPKPPPPQIIKIETGLVQDATLKTNPDPTRQKLELVLGKVEFKGERLDKVLAWFASETDANFVVDWRALGNAQIGNDFPVKVSLRHATARIALKAVLAQMGEGYERASFEVSDGVVRISTVYQLTRLMHTRAYDIRDIIDDVCIKSRRFAGSDDGITEQQAADQIIAMIQSSVDPNTWRDAGNAGTIQYFAGRLVVKQTVENHHELTEVLAGLRHK